MGTWCLGSPDGAITPGVRHLEPTRLLAERRGICDCLALNWAPLVEKARGWVHSHFTCIFYFLFFTLFYFFPFCDTYSFNFSFQLSRWGE